MIQEGMLSQAFPRPHYSEQCSFALNISTAFIFLDYAAHGLGSHPIWYETLVDTLSSEERTSLDLVRHILGHGWALRDFIARTLPVGHLAHQDWSHFWAWYSSLAEPEIEALINEGIICCLEYYQERLKPMVGVDALLDQIKWWDGRRHDWMQSPQRHIAIEAALATWALDGAILPLVAIANEPKRFHKAVGVVLKFLAEQEFSNEWESQLSWYHAHLQQLTAMKPYETLSRLDAITRLTGVEPELRVANIVRTAHSIVFVPCLHLYPSLSLFCIDDVCYVLFEPQLAVTDMSANSPPALALQEEVFAGLEVLGDRVRLSMLQLIKNHPRIQAVDIAALLNIHPSTVSRHCQQLEKADFLHVVREGNIKHYSINSPAIISIGSWLTSIFGD